MSDFPYTDEQVRAFAGALNQPEGFARDDLNALVRAGITVQFPEPRYRAHHDGDWIVVDHGEPHEPTVAIYTEGFHPHPERAAEAEADRLNRKAQL